MARRRKVDVKVEASESPNKIEKPAKEVSLVRCEVKTRISKRFTLLTVLFTLCCAWIALPHVKNGISIPKNIANLSEFLLETSLHQYLPKSAVADDIIGNITTMLKPFWFKSEYGDKNSPGLILRNLGAEAHFPVLLIPGIISTGLELWEGEKCAKPYFRERFWGTLTMLRALIMDGECWMKHMRLDPDTGDDPVDIRIRPAQGLEAADFLLPGFWVWARIIENLAELGYDHNNLMMAAYDWRLSIAHLEKRDHYLTKLKNQIELLKRTNGRKIVIITHSLGASVWHYFMKWVEASLDDPDVKGGNGGRSWINDHIESVAHIGGTFLGAPKSLSTIISGESRETAMLGKIETYFLELFLSRSQRVSLFRTWTGGLGILPKGGNLFWGGPTLVAADHSRDGETIPMVTRRGIDGIDAKYYADDSKYLCSLYLSKNMTKLLESYYSTGLELSQRQIKINDKIHRTWMNPLETQLPTAPQMKIYCFHGIGKGTERGYVYRNTSDSLNIDMVIDTDMTNYASGDLSKGVYRCEGDGTVPLLSLGYMGVKGWRKYPQLNPSSIKVVVREYKDDISNLRVTDVRGGPRSGDHVDILGNHDLTMDLMRIVTNFPEAEADPDLVLKDLILSNIVEIAERIEIPFTE